MPKISQTQRNKRRRQILDAALAAFSENGFHQTALSDIQRRSGLSRGALYLYFQSKDEIIAALAVDRHEQEAALHAAALGSDAPLDGLKRLLGAYAQRLADPAGEAQRRVGVNGWAEALRNEAIRATVVEGIKAPIDTLTRLIRHGQTNGQFLADLDANAAARSLVALFQGFLLQSVWGEKLDLAACVATAERMVDGFLTSPARDADAG